jgi:hypothetical protein
MRHSRVLPEAIFSTWAGDRADKVLAVSSEMPRRNRACSRSVRIRFWASIRYDRLTSRISCMIWSAFMAGS